jgi:7,8-dihydropterin-6-yl-methyl-4-(beta-D-ribofuranosyl)aminobenzene 5'-phosphate synthase
LRKKGSTPVEVKGFQKICDRVYTTGIISGWIKEQSLILDTDKGLVVVTGCAHPRIANIISIVKEKMEKNIYLVLGGFHLAGFSKNELSEIIEEFRSDGVRKVGPCHCTGRRAIQFFAQEYKNDFIEVGVGRDIEVK